jgi:hypothetical protein
MPKIVSTHPGLHHYAKESIDPKCQCKYRPIVDSTTRNSCCTYDEVESNDNRSYLNIVLEESHDKSPSIDIYFLAVQMALAVSAKKMDRQ